MTQVAISEFKARCIELLKSTAETGEDLIITLRGTPLARVSGLGGPQPRRLGAQAEAVVHDPASDRALIASDLEGDWAR